MLSIENATVMNFENALRGARNPMNSWDKSDSNTNENGDFEFGKDDLSLAIKLCKAGSDHRKFMRQIFVSVDISAPLYWWKEYDTYKVATVSNSTSTMHKIHSKPFELKDFSIDKLTDDSLEYIKSTVKFLEDLRVKFIKTKDKNLWYSIIQLLPSSYNQLRTCTFNYETLISIYKSRKNHKLEEWNVFCNWINSLPYAKELIIDI